jgi:DNA-3-methyladenine glycosylase II
MTRALDGATLLAATDELAARDPELAAIRARWGPPPLWDREPGFASLLHIVLEQQVSLASARAAFDRLEAAIGRPAPAAFLDLSDAELLAIGFSRQKARYGRALATAVIDGALDVDGLAGLGDAAARSALLRQVGIGPWTADIYLVMALRRPDVWPTGDLALATAAAEAKGLATRPSDADLAALAESWRPWRAVAARLLWLDYLRRRGRPT